MIKNKIDSKLEWILEDIKQIEKKSQFTTEYKPH